MLLNEKTATIITSGNLTANTFRINASKKAFEILSAGLYSDKVRAIVRELSTNAADAHVAAGKKDVPFEVHVPNQLEPWFAVKDYGTGLSDHQVNTLYTTYFESDKTHSNEFTGCLGLGSKSPFSYVDTFTVESRYNGCKSVYNAYLNEHGVPCIVKMTADPTDEENGITVKFPVKSNDFWSFYERVVSVLQWFDTPPVIVGKSDLVFPKRDYLLKTERFGVYKSHTGTCHLVMGNVAYPLPVYDVTSNMPQDGYEVINRRRRLLEWGVDLFVNIGDIDVSASREKISYDKRTMAVVTEAIDTALAELSTRLAKEIEDQPTLWDARLKYHSIRNSFKGFSLEAKWNGNDVIDFVKVEGAGSPKVIQFRVKRGRQGRDTVVKETSNLILADGSKLFIFDEHGANSKVMRYLQGKPRDTRAYLISDYTEEWLADNGLTNVVVKTSTLPKVERQKRNGQSVAQKAKIYQFVTDASGNSASYWEPAEVDLDEGGVYVEILYFNYKTKNGSTDSPEYLKAPLFNLKQLDKGITLYGIRPADAKILAESEGEWCSFWEYLDDAFQELEDALHKDYLRVYQYEHMRGDSYRANFPFHRFADCKFNEGSDFGKLVSEICEVAVVQKEMKEKLKHYSSLRSVVKGYEEITDNTFSEKYKGVLKKYPLLGYLDSYGYSDHFIHSVCEYVNQMDGK